MIDKFVNIYDAHKGELEELFKTQHPQDYTEIVKMVVELISKYDDRYGTMDPNRIHVIDDGDYQGTLLFVIAENSYQPSHYWSVYVDYGSCSGCDTLENIRCYGSDMPSEQQVKDYMTLALHILQGLEEV